MKFTFDPKQDYQLAAINSVTELFKGQPKDTSNLVSSLNLPSQPVDLEATTLDGEEDDALFNVDVSAEIGAVGNNLVVGDDQILRNLQEIQNHNGLEPATELKDGRQFDIEMETGTGKTYVYLRTVFELARKYNFTKFIILVPSVAIRDGVKTSIELIADHLQ